MIEELIARIPETSTLAPLLGLVAGAGVALSPQSLPTLPVVVTALSPSAVAIGEHAPRRIVSAVPSVFAFVAGMDGLLGVVGAAVVEVAAFFTRAGVVLHLVSATVLGTLGLRLVLRRSSLCRRVGVLPPAPSEAFVFGVVFGVTGCPACAPLAVGVGIAAGLVGGPLLSLLVVTAFVVGRSAVLLLAAAVGARFIPDSTDVERWRRFDLIVGALFLVAALYYVVRVVSGDVVTRMPGEPGGPLP